MLKKPQATIFNMPCGVPTVSARNTSLEIAHTSGVKSLLFIDDDMEFHGDAYERLNLVKADIVCALMFTRSAPSSPTVMIRKMEEGDKFSLRSIVPDGKIQDVHACGMAFTLLRRPVIEWAIADSAKSGLPPFRHIILGEDLDFVNRATMAGFSAKCDTSVITSHRGDIGFAGQPELVNPMSGHLTNPLGTVRS